MLFFILCLDRVKLHVFVGNSFGGVNFLSVRELTRIVWFCAITFYLVFYAPLLAYGDVFVDLVFF